MTKTELRKVENARKHVDLVASFEARLKAADPTDPLTNDPYWNPLHPDHDDDPGRPMNPALLAGDPADDAPTGLPRGNGNGKQTKRQGATEKQIAALAERLRTTHLQEPLFERIRAALNSDEPVAFEDATNALDLLFKEPMGNRYAGTCRACGGHVPADTGYVLKISGRWEAMHAGQCPEEQPEPTPEPVQVEGLDLTVLPVGRYRYADPRHITDPSDDLSRVKIQVDHVAKDKGKWSGWIFVKDAAEYGAGKRYGKQEPGSRYRGDIEDLLTRILADRDNAIAAYGQLTNSCSACNRALEDDESVRLGIGPVCRRKL